MLRPKYAANAWPFPTLTLVPFRTLQAVTCHGPSCGLDSWLCCPAGVNKTHMPRGRKDMLRQVPHSAHHPSMLARSTQLASVHLNNM